MCHHFPSTTHDDYGIASSASSTRCRKGGGIVTKDVKIVSLLLLYRCTTIVKIVEILLHNKGANLYYARLGLSRGCAIIWPAKLNTRRVQALSVAEEVNIFLIILPHSYEILQHHFCSLHYSVSFLRKESFSKYVSQTLIKVAKIMKKMRQKRKL